uniref:Uncharacterized protein n=1 Tax=Chenopodium quinoa TaxID=63459 RepID=A0A803LB10_CHEQI
MVSRFFVAGGRFSWAGKVVFWRREVGKVWRRAAMVEEYDNERVLLQCSSYDKGCRSYVCDTNHLHSNCLDRFKTAYGIPSQSNSPPTSFSVGNENSAAVVPESNCKPTCPLCRGELQKHAQEEHPDSRPSKIDPARQLDWDNFQQSSEMVDVLSTIHSEVPRGVVLGDYVIEYGDDDTADEFETSLVMKEIGGRHVSCIKYLIISAIVEIGGGQEITIQEEEAAVLAMIRQIQMMAL